MHCVQWAVIMPMLFYLVEMDRSLAEAPKELLLVYYFFHLCLIISRYFCFVRVNPLSHHYHLTSFIASSLILPHLLFLPSSIPFNIEIENNVAWWYATDDSSNSDQYSNDDSDTDAQSETIDYHMKIDNCFVMCSNFNRICIYLISINLLLVLILIFVYHGRILDWMSKSEPNVEDESSWDS